MKSSEALKQARRLIADYRDKFVCVALRRIDPSGSTDVLKNLSRIFGGPTTVNSWLEECVDGMREWSDRASDYEYDSTMREYRLRWIDWMIPQYEAKGD